MGRPLPLRGITGHLVWGEDGAAWAVYEVEPFGYPHRSARDAREMHARTVAALLGLPTQSLILSITYAVSAAELEERIRGRTSPGSALGWSAVTRRTAQRLASEGAFERRWFLALRLDESDGGRRWLDGLRAAASEVGSAFGAPPPTPGPGRTRVALSAARSVADRLSQHLRLRPLSAGQARWLYQRAVLRGLVDPPMPDGDGREGVSVVRLDRDAVYVEGGRRSDPDRPRHWRYLTVEHPDHGLAHQAFSCLAEMPASWTFPYGSGEWLWHLDDQLPFPVDWAVRIERVDNQTARRRALRAKRNLVGQLTEPGGDPAGPATTLAAAADAVDEHRARLESNPALPAFRATTTVAVAHRDLA